MLCFHYLMIIFSSILGMFDDLSCNIPNGQYLVNSETVTPLLSNSSYDCHINLLQALTDISIKN